MNNRNRDLGIELGERIYAEFKKHRRRSLAEYLARTHREAKDLIGELAARATRRLSEIGVDKVLEMSNKELAGILREVGDEVLSKKSETRRPLAKRRRLRVIRGARSG